VLWSGIAAPQLAQLGANARWAWLGTVGFALLILPLFVPKPEGTGRARAFQVTSLLVALVALGGGVALRRDAPLDAFRSGARASIAALLGAPVPASGKEPRDVLATLLAGEQFQVQKIARVPPGFSESMTRASARHLAGVLAGRMTTYVELVSIANPNDAKLEKLGERARAAAADAAKLGDREALDAVLQVHADLTRELLSSGRQDYDAMAKAAIERGAADAMRATCEPRAELLHCRLEQVLYVLEREDGAWRVNRPEGSDHPLFALPFGAVQQTGGETGAAASPAAEGTDEARALATLTVVQRASMRVLTARTVDPAIVDVLTDDGAAAMWLIVLKAGTLALLRRNSPGVEVMMQEDRRPPAEIACHPREELRKLIEKYNGVASAEPFSPLENTAVEELVNRIGLRRDGDDTFVLVKPGSEVANGTRLLLRDGVWRYDAPRDARLRCE
jgi:hypothetical protein